MYLKLTQHAMSITCQLKNRHHTRISSKQRGKEKILQWPMLVVQRKWNEGGRSLRRKQRQQERREMKTKHTSQDDLVLKVKPKKL